MMIETEAMKEAMKLLKSVAKRERSVETIVNISTDKDSVLLSALYEGGIIRIRVKASCDEVGIYNVSLDSLENTIAKLRGYELCITKKEHTLRIKSDNAKIEIRILNTTFPGMEKVENNLKDSAPYVFHASSFSQCVQMVGYALYAEDSSDMRGYMECMIMPDGFKLTALDGIRIHQAWSGSIDVKVDTLYFPGLLIKKLSSYFTEEISVQYKTGDYIIKSGEITVIGHHNTFRYFNTDKIIESMPTNKVLVDTDVFKNAFSLVGGLCPYTDFHFKADELVLEGVSKDISVTDSLTCSSDKEETIRLTSKFIFDVISSCKEDMLQIRFSGSKSPVFFSCENRTAVVMPINKN